MTDSELKARNDERLSECWPAFRVKVAAILSDMRGHGWRPRIQEAWRSPADQEAAFQAGHSQLEFGFHNVTGAGGKPEALAVDVLDDNNPNQESTRFLLMLASSAESHGLHTGIRWGLPDSARQAINNAVLDKDWNAPVKVGWDASHVEPVSITPQQAKEGARI